MRFMVIPQSDASWASPAFTLDFNPIMIMFGEREQKKFKKKKKSLDATDNNI